MNIYRLTLLVTAALMMTACAVPSVRQTIERPEATPQPSPAASEPIVRTLPGSGVQETPLTVKPLPQTAPPAMPKAPLEPGIERAPVAELPASTEQGSPVAQRPAAARGTQLALATPAPTGGAAAKALAKRADAEMRGNDLMAAAATLERALRIEPSNAGLWSRLAEVRLRQGDLSQAEQLALKSNGLAGGNAALRARNEQIIARARGR